MTKINLKELYPELYPKDTYLFIKNEILAQEIVSVFEIFRKEDHAFYERRRANKAYYLYEEAFTETIMQNQNPSLDEMYERVELEQALYSALNQLSSVQLRRVYAFFFLGYSKSKIARLEGVDRSSVRQSIDRALKQIRKKLSDYL